MQDFAHSSEGGFTRGTQTATLTWRVRIAIACSAVALFASGCVTVRPEERELLAEPEMTFGSDAQVQSHEQHVFSNREGSFGAGAVSGGGCGCN